MAQEGGRSEPNKAPLKSLRPEEGAAVPSQQWGGASLSSPCQDTKWPSCSAADILWQSKRITPDEPFQQGSGRGDMR